MVAIASDTFSLPGLIFDRRSLAARFGSTVDRSLAARSTPEGIFFRSRRAQSPPEAQYPLIRGLGSRLWTEAPTRAQVPLYRYSIRRSATGYQDSGMGGLTPSDGEYTGCWP